VDAAAEDQFVNGFDYNDNVTVTPDALSAALAGNGGEDIVISTSVILRKTFLGLLELIQACTSKKGGKAQKYKRNLDFTESQPQMYY
jgi:hypothetical protein